ncbi:translation factor pelota, variant [Fonticula alba]|uniref:Translation factor pelota, variant n=1 Tax=Fonticula alba TaxID=691883 RepID=A0A058Z7H0_FONAL|nr:translation factor pelota, variant [Fonticula alba]KCV70225.1 translation factor pelota, variant [Fonticula alba]|eukprot:XP_009494741.1 translation factor pelota, variant [Fonticula alba]
MCVLRKAPQARPGVGPLSPAVCAHLLPDCHQSQDSISHFTHKIDTNTSFSLSRDIWKHEDVEHLKENQKTVHPSTVNVIAMHSGLAHVCSVSNNITVVYARIEQTIPKNARRPEEVEKATQKFFTAVSNAIDRYMVVSKSQRLVIAGPGYIAREFVDFLGKVPADKYTKDIRAMLPHIIVGHCSSGHKSAITEIFSDPNISRALAQEPLTKDVVVLDEFFSSLNNNPMLTTYSFPQVQAAAYMSAVKVLLVTDTVVRGTNVSLEPGPPGSAYDVNALAQAIQAHRDQYTELMNQVTLTGGRVHIFKSAHPAGERLDALTGCAAILHFPLEGLEEGADEGPETGATEPTIPALPQKPFTLDRVQREWQASISASGSNVFGPGGSSEEKFRTFSLNFFADNQDDQLNDTPDGPEDLVHFYI